MRRAAPELILSPSRNNKRQAYGSWGSGFTSKRRAPVSPSPPRPPSASMGGLTAHEIDHRFQEVNAQQKQATSSYIGGSRRYFPQTSESHLHEDDFQKSSHRKLRHAEERHDVNQRYPNHDQTRNQAAGSIPMHHGGRGREYMPSVNTKQRVGLSKPSPTRRPSNSSLLDTSNTSHANTGDSPIDLPVRPGSHSYNTLRRRSTSETRSNAPQVHHNLAAHDYMSSHRVQKRHYNEGESGASKQQVHQTTHAAGTRPYTAPKRLRLDQLPQSTDDHPRYASHAPIPTTSTRFPSQGRGQRDRSLTREGVRGMTASPSHGITPNPIRPSLRNAKLNQSQIDNLDEGMTVSLEWANETIYCLFKDAVHQNCATVPHVKLEPMLRELVHANDWDMQMRALKDVEHILDFNYLEDVMDQDSKWSKQATSQYVDALHKITNSPRSGLSRCALQVLFKLIILYGHKFNYTSSNVDTLLTLALKKAQEHVHPVFITDIAKRVFWAWLLYTPSLGDVSAALDRVFGATKIVLPTLAINGLLLFCCRNTTSGMDILPLCRSIVYGLKSISDKGKKQDRELSNIAQFLVLVLENSKTQLAAREDDFNRAGSSAVNAMTRLSPSRPRASISPNVLAICDDIDGALHTIDQSLRNYIR